MKILEHMERFGHEQLVVCHEPSVGLKAFIAIHDTTLGPACGGVRVWPHPTEDEVRQAISGVVCRCTGYAKIVEAVLAAAEEL